MSHIQITPAYIKKCVLSFIGIFILSIGTAMMNKSSMGVDPFTSLNMGLQDRLGIPLGGMQIITNAILFIFVFVMDKKRIGVGTILNMVFVGIFIQLLSPIFPEPSYIKGTIIPSPGQILLAGIGIIVFTFGAALYQSPNVGVAPYDAIAPILSQRTGKQYKVVRVIQDVSTILIAFLLAGFAHIGICSIITAFFTGPLISFWMNKVGNPLVKKIDQESEPATHEHVLTRNKNKNSNSSQKDQKGKGSQSKK